MKTKVFITIDTEFSIGGAFEAPLTVKPIGAQNVWCEVGGQSQGLGFMLDTFAEHGLAATFFVEALQTAYFGDEPMGAIARHISAAGHDVQLHLHPVWTYFDHPQWQAQLAHVQPTDNMHGRSVEQAAAWMQRGIDSFVRWGVSAPAALRTGNLMVDRTVYQAMQAVGLKVASNIARAVFEPAEQALRLNAGIHTVEGITELPVLTYTDLQWGARTHHKLLTITGTSVAEAQCLLARAHESGARAVVLLTHCHELVKGDMQGSVVADRVNQKRLAALCRFLRQANDRFEVTTIGGMVALPVSERSADHAMLQVPTHLAMARMAQNKLNELNWI